MNPFGEARCSVTFDGTSIPVVWHIISGSCEPILSGNAALQLGIIQFNKTEETFQPILMIAKESKGNLQNILAEYPQNFSGLGKLKVYKVKLYCKPDGRETCECTSPLISLSFERASSESG